MLGDNIDEIRLIDVNIYIKSLSKMAGALTVLGSTTEGYI
jgi:hypothetical protein